MASSVASSMPSSVPSSTRFRCSSVCADVPGVTISSVYVSTAGESFAARASERSMPCPNSGVEASTTMCFACPFWVCISFYGSTMSPPISVGIRNPSTPSRTVER